MRNLVKLLQSMKLLRITSAWKIVLSQSSMMKSTPGESGGAGHRQILGFTDGDRRREVASGAPHARPRPCRGGATVRPSTRLQWLPFP